MLKSNSDKNGNTKHRFLLWEAEGVCIKTNPESDHTSIKTPLYINKKTRVIKVRTRYYSTYLYIYVLLYIIYLIGNKGNIR